MSGIAAVHLGSHERVALRRWTPLLDEMGTLPKKGPCDDVRQTGEEACRGKTPQTSSPRPYGATDVSQSPRTCPEIRNARVSLSTGSLLYLLTRRGLRAHIGSHKGRVGETHTQGVTRGSRFSTENVGEGSEGDGSQESTCV
jgi:hypothetical protein